MKNITLEGLLYRKYLITTFISVFLIGLFLIFFYFIVNNNMIEKSKDSILKNLENFIALTVSNQSKIKTEQFLEYLSLKTFPYDGKILLLNSDGKIEYINENLANLLNTKKGDNILNNATYKISAYFKDILNEKIADKIVLNNQNYLLFPKKIENTSFYLVCIIDEKNILIETNNLMEYCKHLEYLLVFGVGFFYLLSFFYLSHTAKNFVFKINQPLSKIVEFTKTYGKREHF